MLKIGITGGIGSGKSVVTRLFGQLGVPVFDSDAEAKRLINTDPAIIRAITEAFGSSAYLANGQGLDRKAVASLVFQDSEKLAQLNRITHPPVIQAAQDWIKQKTEAYHEAINKWQNQRDWALKNAKAVPPTPVGYLIKEAALLFESGSNKPLDFILGVYAEKPVRIERIMLRDSLTEQAAINRISKQMDEEQKMDKCDGIIFNNGNQLLWPQVMNWHRQFQQRVLENTSQV
ncbi:dephospho-CoA kinase [Arachidicoccus rhizosphaerae]|jgi:dephospho-CoA kinase|uniref:Dephospho-CoA kinase n=1 Tax=Arachidicoccus rhizosphaerae TaxID=551991 RepID=A0A1H3Z6G3_9BACT|nr:dephospho-CoA kinase [Arachidicoccus rhizosphaerae]SEA19240.1 dephospho-CoA kinase [Arachidicoccus rhizosphaerae]